jgi:hypothetical protein
VARLKQPGTLFKEIHFRVVLLKEVAITMHMTKTRLVKQTNSKKSTNVSILNSTMIVTAIIMTMKTLNQRNHAQHL